MYGKEFNVRFLMHGILIALMFKRLISYCSIENNYISYFIHQQQPPYKLHVTQWNS